MRNETIIIALNFIKLVKSGKLAEYTEFTEKADEIMSNLADADTDSIFENVIIPLLPHLKHLGDNPLPKIEYFIEALYTKYHEENKAIDEHIYHFTEQLLLALNNKQDAQGNWKSYHIVIFDIATKQYGVTKEKFIQYLAEELRNDEDQAENTAILILHLINAFTKEDRLINLHKILFANYSNDPESTPLQLMLNSCNTEEYAEFYFPIFHHQSFQELSPEDKITTYSKYIFILCKLDTEHYFSELGKFLIIENRKALEHIRTSQATSLAADAEAITEDPNNTYTSLAELTNLTEQAHFADHYANHDLFMDDIISTGNIHPLIKLWLPSVRETLNSKADNMQYLLVTQLNFLAQFSKRNNLSIKTLTHFIIFNFERIKSNEILMQNFRLNPTDFINLGIIPELDTKNHSLGLALISTLWYNRTNDFFEELANTRPISKALELANILYHNPTNSKNFFSQDSSPILSRKVTNIRLIQFFIQLWQANNHTKEEIVSKLVNITNTETLSKKPLTLEELILTKFLQRYKDTATDVAKVNLELLIDFANESNLPGFIETYLLLDDHLDSKTQTFNNQNFKFFLRFLNIPVYQKIYQENKEDFYFHLTQSILSEELPNRDELLIILLDNGIFGHFAAKVHQNKDNIINIAKEWSKQFASDITQDEIETNDQATEKSKKPKSNAQKNNKKYKEFRKNKISNFTKAISHLPLEDQLKTTLLDINDDNIDQLIIELLSQINNTQTSAKDRLILCNATIKLIELQINLLSKKQDLGIQEANDKISELKQHKIATWQLQQDLNEKSAILIQSKARQFLATNTANQIRQNNKESNAATIIQTKARQFLATKTVDQIRQNNKESNAATIIQTKARQFLATKAVKKALQDQQENQAAIVIQSAYRQKAALNKYQQLIEEKDKDLKSTIQAQQELISGLILGQQDIIQQKQLLEAQLERLQTESEQEKTELTAQISTLEIAARNNADTLQTQVAELNDKIAELENLLSREKETNDITALKIANEEVALKQKILDQAYELHTLRDSFTYAVSDVMSLQSSLQIAQQSNQSLYETNKLLKQKSGSQDLSSLSSGSAQSQRRQSSSSFNSDSPIDNSDNETNKQKELYIKMHTVLGMSLDDIARIKGENDAKSDLSFDPNLTIDDQPIDREIYTEAFEAKIAEITFKAEQSHSDKSAAERSY